MGFLLINQISNQISVGNIRSLMRFNFCSWWHFFDPPLELSFQILVLYRDWGRGKISDDSSLTLLLLSWNP